MTARRQQKHGLNTLMRAVSARGMGVLDGRSAAVRALVGWRKELTDSLGGEAHLSAQELALIELCCRTRLFLDHVDSWLLQQSSLINRRKKSALPVLLQRMQLADALARHLGSLGLKRRLPEPPSLESYLASEYGNDEANPQPKRSDTHSGSNAETPAAPDGELEQ